MADFDNDKIDGFEAEKTDGEPLADGDISLESSAESAILNGDEEDIVGEVTIEEISCQNIPQNGFGEPVFDQSRMNEYIYNDYAAGIYKKNRAGRIVLWAAVAVLATVAISYTSIFTYITLSERKAASEKIEEDNFFISDTFEGEQDSSASKISPSSNEKNTAAEKDFPTLEQLATPKDAMALPDIYDKVSPSVVGVSCTRSTGTSTGTGIIISEDGYIITNAHVLKNFVEITIVDNSLNEYTAELIGSDDQTDIAVLKINGKGLTACEFGKSGELRIGELSIVIGNPLGFDLYGTMTTGIISGLNRTVTIGDNTMTLIQTQASVNKGNSGGPLINCYGQVIGITSAKVDSAYGEGLGFAIPIDEALPIVEDLMAYGYVTGRPMIGFNGENITAFIAMYYRLPQGALVRFVTPDSGAEKAGLKSNDIIIGMNGETVTTMEEISAMVNKCAVGDVITLTVYRDGVAMDIEMVLGEITSNDR